jgi:hypothetical protein
VAVVRLPTCSFLHRPVPRGPAARPSSTQAELRLGGTPSVEERMRSDVRQEGTQDQAEQTARAKGPRSASSSEAAGGGEGPTSERGLCQASALATRNAIAQDLGGDGFGARAPCFRRRRSIVRRVSSTEPALTMCGLETSRELSAARSKLRRSSAGNSRNNYHSYEVGLEP